MKKSIFILISVVTTLLQAQSFKLSPLGFVNAEEPSKTYVVLEFPEKTKEEIYKQVMFKLNKMFNSPKDVLSVLENESITINAIDSKRVRRTSMHSFKNRYTLTLEFKNGKMKINAPIFELTNYYSRGLQKLHLMYKGLSLGGENLSIYSKNGDPKRQKAITDLNAFANTYIEVFKETFSKKEDW